MRQVRRVAIISVHGSPLDAIGGKDTGGMNVFVGELGRELAARGIEVDLFTRWNDPAAKQIVEMAPGFRIVHVKAGEMAPVEKDRLPEHLPEFMNTLREFVGRQGLEYDVVHSHYWLSAWVAEKAARSWDIPWVAMYHTLGRVKKHHRGGREGESAANRGRTEDPGRSGRGRLRQRRRAGAAQPPLRHSASENRRHSLRRGSRTVPAADSRDRQKEAERRGRTTP